MDKPHFYRVGPKSHGYDDESEFEAGEVRKDIEPWLSAVFQSEHLSLLVGNGFPTAISSAAGAEPADMSLPEFECDLNDEIDEYAKETAEAIGRGEPNFEDKIRVASQLVTGLKILGDDQADGVIESLDKALTDFLNSLLETEEGIVEAIEDESEEGISAKELHVSFLLSFASRSVTRERLHIFTTNYERLIEYGCDIVGLRVIDRFIGGLSPIFRSSRVEVDLHYNPPGIRGEPRYLEGVIRLTKLHGSIDWIFEGGKVRRYSIPFGAETGHPDLPENPYSEVMIYPNPAKDVETLEYPCAELFRDFASALCRPNSVIVTYGYGFGDDHINRVITDMLTIPSTHLVIISYGKLSSYARKNRTKKAIWELDNILRSIYILRYVDDLLLRQNVQRALNRGEAYHQLPRAISHEHSGKLRVATEEDQLVWSECSRLVANAIIFYNSYLLSKLLVKLENNKRIDLVEQIKRVSPIAWRHVNLGGRFELTSIKKTPDIDTMMAMLEEFLYNSRK